MNEKPNYYAIIPANIRYNENLNSSQKLFYGEITALTFKTGECWASNNYFARLYKVSPSVISNWVKALERENLIVVDYETKGKEITKRIIKIVGIQNIDYVFNKNEEGYSKNIKENNTSINNTSIYTTTNSTVARKEMTFFKRVLLWLPTILTAIIACLDYIPLARLSMDIFPDAAGNIYTYFFPARMMNAVFLWAVVNGAIGLVVWVLTSLIENGWYTLYSLITGKENKADWGKFKGLMVKPMDLLKDFMEEE